MLDGNTQSFSEEYKAYRPGVALFPLILVMILAVATRMVSVERELVARWAYWSEPQRGASNRLFGIVSQHVFIRSLCFQVEFSLLSTIFVGACMVEGEVNEGFKRMLDT